MIYLASPYSHPDPAVRESRFLVACKAAAAIMRQGKLVFSPIAHSHPIAMAGDLPKGWAYWERLDHAMVAVCSEVVVLTIDGWKESRGIAGELAIARELCLPIRYWDPSLPMPVSSAAGSDPEPEA